MSVARLFVELLGLCLVELLKNLRKLLGEGSDSAEMWAIAGMASRGLFSDMAKLAIELLFVLGLLAWELLALEC